MKCDSHNEVAKKISGHITLHLRKAKKVPRFDPFLPQKSTKGYDVQGLILLQSSSNFLSKNYKATVSKYNSEKCKKYEIRVTGKTTLFRRDFQTLNTRPARIALSLNVNQFCKPKSSCFMRETDFVFLGIFDVV